MAHPVLGGSREGCMNYFGPQPLTCGGSELRGSEQVRFPNEGHLIPRLHITSKKLTNLIYFNKLHLRLLDYVIIPYLLEVQSDLLEPVNTRVVVPLALLSATTTGRHKSRSGSSAARSASAARSMPRRCRWCCRVCGDDWAARRHTTIPLSGCFWRGDFLTGFSIFPFA